MPCNLLAMLFSRNSTDPGTQAVIWVIGIVVGIIVMIVKAASTDERGDALRPVRITPPLAQTKTTETLAVVAAANMRVAEAQKNMLTALDEFEKTDMQRVLGSGHYDRQLRVKIHARDLASAESCKMLDVLGFFATPDGVVGALHVPSDRALGFVADPASALLIGDDIRKGRLWVGFHEACIQDVESQPERTYVYAFAARTTPEYQAAISAEPPKAVFNA